MVSQAQRETNSRVLIIGVGNAYRGDDAAGLEAARQLKAEHPDATVVEANGEGLALLELWQDAGFVILIDAVRSGATSGTIYHFDARTDVLPAALFGCSSHAFGIAQAIELARVLHQLPPRLIVYGIEGANFRVGTTLSAQVARAAHIVVQEIVQTIPARVAL